MDKKTNSKGKKKMDFTRLTNLLYEASSSLVPGTGKLYSTMYTNDDEKEEVEYIEDDKD
ncbi:hypothetical protein [Candidatus Clostridium radicumherbarum]|uniref:Uncharacterized protein n=1 Tax=Candidatus Clostridium radicumherbarum TaxID=3381662 RepID=A0ABW8TYT5_9CLOT